VLKPHQIMLIKFLQDYTLELDKKPDFTLSARRKASSLNLDDDDESDKLRSQADAENLLEQKSN